MHLTYERPNINTEVINQGHKKYVKCPSSMRLPGRGSISYPNTNQVHQNQRKSVGGVDVLVKANDTWQQPTDRRTRLVIRAQNKLNVYLFV